MGVTNLWSILAPVKQHTPLSSLQGQTVAVDLSIWVCENQCVKSMQGVVTRPYLRNLFFRVSYLTQLGVRLVFVIEGAAPQLKWQEMQRRQQAMGRGAARSGRGGRAHFNARLRECCQLLDLMGIPYIQSRGEAEAMCAALNAAGLVDACITDDGDVFLYGARTVYKNFTMNNKDPHVESYSMSSIEETLGISRESLVGVALLLGCDYLPGGVPGVGVDRVIKYLDSLKGVDLLRRFYQWSSLSPSQCVSKIEILIRQKALAVPDFPQTKVIAEFMVDQEVVPKSPFMWCRPHITKTQEYAEAKMEWPPDYTTEKVLPLVTLWDLSHLAQTTNSNIRHLKPNRIVKPRVRHGVPVYEVEWWKQADDTETSHEFYVTMEEQVLFGRVFPHLVEEYEEEKAAKKNKKKTGPRKSKKNPQCPEELDEELSSQLRSLDLDENCETETASSSQHTCPQIPSHLDHQTLKQHPDDSSRTQSKHVTKSKRTMRHKSKEVCSEIPAGSLQEIQNKILCSGSSQSETTAKSYKSRKVGNSRREKGCTNPGTMEKERTSECYTNTTENGNTYEVCNPGSVNQNGHDRLTDLDSDSEKENEDVFLSLSQRLQLKLGQTSKLRSMSNGFETCLALKQNQKKCNSVSAVGEVLNQRVQPKDTKVREVNKKHPDLSYNTGPTGPHQSRLPQKDFKLSDVDQNESFPTRNGNLCLQCEDTISARPNQASIINPCSAGQHGSFYNESSVHHCRPLMDVSVKHDFSHVAHMMTIINTPEVVRQSRVTESDKTHCETSQQMVQVDNQKALFSSSVLDLPPCPPNFQKDKYIDLPVSQECLKQSSSPAVNPLDVSLSETTSPFSCSAPQTYLSNDIFENPKSFLQSDDLIEEMIHDSQLTDKANITASPQMRVALSTLCPLTPASGDKADAVSSRGKVLLYQTPSPLVSTNLQKTVNSPCSKSIFSKNPSLVYQTPSPLSVTTLDVTMQFGHFNMQASLLNDSPANLSSDVVSPCISVQGTAPAIRCPDFSSSATVNNSTSVPSVKTNLSSAVDSPVVFNVGKFELPSAHPTNTDVPGTMNSAQNHGCNVDDLDSSFSSLALASKATAVKSNSESLQVSKISFSEFKSKDGEGKKGRGYVSLQQHCHAEALCDTPKVKKEMVSKFTKDGKYGHVHKAEIPKDERNYVSETVTSSENNVPVCPGTNVFADASELSKVKADYPVKRKSKLSLKRSSSSVSLDQSVPPPSFTDTSSYSNSLSVTGEEILHTSPQNLIWKGLGNCKLSHHQAGIPDLSESDSMIDLCEESGFGEENGGIPSGKTKEGGGISSCKTKHGGIHSSKTKDSQSVGSLNSLPTNKVMVNTPHCKPQTEAQKLNKAEKKDPLVPVTLPSNSDDDKVFEQKIAGLGKLKSEQKIAGLGKLKSEQKIAGLGKLKSVDVILSYPIKADRQSDRSRSPVSDVDHSVSFTNLDSVDHRRKSLIDPGSVHDLPVSVSECKEDSVANGMDSVCDQTTVESPISLSDRLKNRLSSNARVALQTLSSQRQFGMSLNVKPLN